MSDLLKSTAKLAACTCVSLCAVTVAASVAIGNSFGKAVTAGFKGAKGAIKEELAAQKENAESNEEAEVYVSADTENSSDEEKVSADNCED